MIVICVAARARYLRANPEAKLEDLVIYTTTQTHSLGVKAGLVLGLEVRALEVKKEDEYGVRGETVRAALQEDVARGKRPFIFGEPDQCMFFGFMVMILCAVATVGSTNSGAIDDLHEIGEVCEYE